MPKILECHRTYPNLPLDDRWKVEYVFDDGFIERCTIDYIGETMTRADFYIKAYISTFNCLKLTEEDSLFDRYKIDRSKYDIVDIQIVQEMFFQIAEMYFTFIHKAARPTPGRF